MKNTVHMILDAVENLGVNKNNNVKPRGDDDIFDTETH